MTLGARTIWCAYAILLGLAILPIGMTMLPPLFDYPNHLARMHLLAEGGDRFYAVAWSALPNLAEDLIVPPLAALLPLALAGKLFLVMTLASLAAGPLLLSRMVHGKWNGWALGGFLMLYSRTLLWGFLNYLFGLGLAFCAVAVWLALAGRAWWLRIIIGSTSATLIYFCHIEAFGCYALMIIGFEITDWRWRKITLGAIQFVIPAALFLGARLTAGGDAWHYADFSRKADLLFGIFDNYHRPIDIACFAALIILLVALGAARALRVDRGGAAALGLLVAAYLLLPSQLLSGSGADHRLPVALFLLFFAVSRPTLTVRRQRLIAAGLLALFAIRIGLIAAVWRSADLVYRADLDLLDLLPSGATLAVAYPPDANNMVAIPETHIATMAIIDREAFVPTLFAYPAQQPISLKEPYAALAASVSPEELWSAFDGARQADRFGIPHSLADFDYAVFLGRHLAEIGPNPCLQTIGGTDSFRLLKVDHAACLPRMPN